MCVLLPSLPSGADQSQSGVIRSTSHRGLQRSPPSILVLLVLLPQADLQMDPLQDLRAAINNVLHLQEAGGRQVADDVGQLQAEAPGVAEAQQLLEHRGVPDDRQRHGAHLAQRHVVAEVRRAGGEDDFVRPEALALHVDHDVAETALNAQLVQVRQHRVTEVWDVQLDAAGALHAAGDTHNTYNTYNIHIQCTGNM